MKGFPNFLASDNDTKATITVFPDWKLFLEQVAAQGCDFITFMPYPTVEREREKVLLGLNVIVSAQKTEFDRPFFAELSWIYNNSVEWTPDTNLEGLFEVGPLAGTFQKWVTEFTEYAKTVAPKAKILIYNIQTVA